MKNKLRQFAKSVKVVGKCLMTLAMVGMMVLTNPMETGAMGTNALNCVVGTNAVQHLQPHTSVQGLSTEQSDTTVLRNVLAASSRGFYIIREDSSLWGCA